MLQSHSDPLESQRTRQWGESQGHSSLLGWLRGAGRRGVSGRTLSEDARS